MRFISVQCKLASDPIFSAVKTLKFYFQLTSQPDEDSEDLPGNFPSSDSGIQALPLPCEAATCGVQGNM